MSETPAGIPADAAAPTAALDPITVQVIANVLLSIADEVGLALRRASYSTNIKERADCSTALFDRHGRLVAQAEHIPIHMGSMAGAVRRLTAPERLATLRPGDVYITNDPYSGGGTHLPDITMVAPVFTGDRLIGFTANIAHHSDVGGHVPGSNSGDSTSIFMEGLRIPLVRFATDGRVNQDIADFVLLNSRLPEERRGDLLAQTSALRLGADRFVELTGKYGIDTVEAACAELLAHAERRLRVAVGALPDGTYTALDHLDADGPGREPIAVAVAVTVAGESITLDFTGTGPEAVVAVNVVRSALEATVYYALKAALDPEIPANGGFFDAVGITAPLGCLVNPREPAPVAARTDACQRVADVVFAALAQAVPEIPAGSHSSITYVNFSGLGEPFYVYPEVIAGGSGAGPDLDGLDAVQVHVTNSSNLPVEALEAEYPLLVERYELVRDSGGAGHRRGGLAVRRDVRVLSAEGAEFSAHADRQSIGPHGSCGGADGTPGRFTVLRTDGSREILPGGRVSGVRLGEGDVMRVDSPGAGGYGDPHTRDPELVRLDVVDERVSPEAARDHYGVVLTAGHIVDRAATDALRTRD
ncbi:hydantoinase B/oxoprolinase family protein [Streptomyces olivaceus]|uniref:hydantoinase B/oxoprolinase family protein n=1 Tax=Streptomyces TaxID=1883 RepID=UPI001FB5C940|nr:hydantoinase B/oxoprolinase family protein [Streptomyces sp. CB09030]UOG79535.1 hydantoinase B/oxoprolinase family protein [Streptomyces sp. CB09030]